jgi:adenylate kinase
VADVFDKCFGKTILYFDAHCVCVMVMVKWVVLIMGTPCVGKTSVARLLAERLNALYINLTELAFKENLVLGRDEKRNTVIVDERRIKKAISKLVDGCGEQTVVVDGHYAASVVPKKVATHVFVLRRDPVELRKFMEEAGFSGNKLWENLAAEILDVCLIDALNVYGSKKVCEIDASGKSVKEIVAEILQVLNGSRKCYVGVVDWLGKLEREGLLEEYLKI